MQTIGGGFQFDPLNQSTIRLGDGFVCVVFVVGFVV